jgi:hypothetical protein
MPTADDLDDPLGFGDRVAAAGDFTAPDDLSGLAEASGNVTFPEQDAAEPGGERGAERTDDADGAGDKPERPES